MASSALPAIELLSDDEPAVASQTQDGVSRATQSDEKSGINKVPPVKKHTRHSLHVRTLHVLATQCRCSRLAKTRRPSCFKQFADLSKDIVDLRWELVQLHKKDSDSKDGLRGFFKFSGSTIFRSG